MSHIILEDYTLRGSVDLANPPVASDYIELGPRSLVALYFPATWTGQSISIFFDIGNGTTHAFTSVSGVPGRIDTLTRNEYGRAVPVNRMALIPNVAQGVDMVFKLILNHNKLE